MVYERIGDLLLGLGLITKEQLEEALVLQHDGKKRLGEVLVEQGFVTESQIIEALEVQLGVQYIDLTKTVIPTEMAQLLSKNIAEKHGVVPVRADRNSLYLAMRDPLNFVALEEVKAATRKHVIPMAAFPSAVERAIRMLYDNDGAVRAMEEMKREVYAEPDSMSAVHVNYIDEEEAAPTIRFVNAIIAKAVQDCASDIHLEPHAEELRVRMRIDGLMRNVMTVPKELQNSVISCLKVMGGMDIAERKVPQDGRTNVRIKQKTVDLRMSTLPTIHGEKLVIRILDRESLRLDKAAIGLTGKDLEKYNALLESQSGVILIVGPTGSGKSSTMYTMLSELSTEEVNIVTLEDPVEYHLEGMNQVQINEKTGMVFSSGLRAVLRQDPDIIGVGEIRDGETASIAMRAAITGHLVFSTVHTSNAAAAIDRLLDIGVEPYLIADAVRGIISQRLVRRICPYCRKAYEATEKEKMALGMPPDKRTIVYRGCGCSECFHTGYRGRTGVFEIMILNREIRRAIVEGADRERIWQLLSEKDFVSLADNCRKLVLDGVTTPEEAIKTIHSADL